MRRAGALPALAAGLAAALAFGCAKPPDPDGARARAGELALGSWHADRLHCREGDCVDWYRARVSAKGTLHVEVRTQVSQGVHPAVTVALLDGSGTALARSSSLGRARLRLARPAEPGRYLLSVEPDDPERRPPLHYELRARYEAPPPPEPEFEAHVSPILEVEGSLGDPQAVLLESGRGEGLRAGLQGRLKEGERVLAPVEIVETYPDGSRARLDGPLQAPITADTVAEIDVPVD